MDKTMNTTHNMGFIAHFVSPNALHFAKPENIGCKQEKLIAKNSIYE